MLDLKYVRENLAETASRLKKRGLTFDTATFEAIEVQRRQSITEAETLKAGKKQLSQKIGELKKAKEDATELMDRVALMDEQLIAAEAEAAKWDERLNDILKTTPNLPDSSVPEGESAEQNVIVHSSGNIPKFDFIPKPHWDLGESLNILDFERAAKVTGARFTFYRGLGARLERALIQFMLDTQTQTNGYEEFWTPLMVNAETLYGTGQLPKFEAELFKLRSVPNTRGLLETFEFLVDSVNSAISISADPNEDDRVVKQFEILERFLDRRKNEIPNEFMVEVRKTVDLWKKVPHQVRFDLADLRPMALGIRDIEGQFSTWARNVAKLSREYYLIPTAEVPLTNFHRDETFEENQLPLKYCAYTPCFRSEAGAYGKDTRGMVRQHQFNKVELVKFTTPETSAVEHEKLTADAEAILEALKLPYRRMLLCAGDMGFGASKCYDLEVYSAGQEKKWWECSSCSNFGDFQARRANIKVKLKDGKKVLAHTINGSGLATSRVLPAIMENYQQADGTIMIPEVLRPYMGGLERITRK